MPSRPRREIQITKSCEILFLVSLYFRLASRWPMSRATFRNEFRQLPYTLPVVVVIVLSGLMLNCTKKAEAPKAAPSRPSDINVEVRTGGPILLTTSTAEFQIQPSGFIQATLLKNGKRLTLDEPGP